MNLVDLRTFRLTPRHAGAAAGLALLTHLAAATALAHEGHDHGPPRETAAETGETPRRLADGSVFLPKASQRLLGIRTAIATAATHAINIEVSGRLAADPDGVARITAMRDGRIEPGEKGLPYPGQRVTAGEVVGFLNPSLSAFEEAQLRQRQSEIEKELALLLPRSEHLGVVNPNMPMGDATVQLLQEMQIQAQALTQQNDLIKQTLAARIAITAPIAGTVSETALARGASVVRGQTLLDIVDRTRARVEAYGFGAVPADIAGATAQTRDGRTLKLAYLGRAPVLRQQAVQLIFAVDGSAEAFEIGQLLKVRIATPQKAQGMALPAAAIQRGTAGGQIVWEHAGAETFLARRVSVQPAEAGRVLVTGEIADGARIVVEGAVFIGQVR